jgi:Putative auto-transporter adhesin, head GIN domain
MDTSAPHVSKGARQRRVYLAVLAALAAAAGTGVVLSARHDGGSSARSVQGSGVPATQARHVGAFTAVDLAGSTSVTVRVGGSRAVVVRADDNLVRLVRTEVRNGELVIANRGSFTTKTPMTVSVTVPTLDRAMLAGSGALYVSGVRAERFSASLAGVGVFVATGRVGLLEARVSGTGNLRLERLAARDADVSIAGTGQIDVRVKGTLRAAVDGSGAIVYSGNPRVVSRSITGTGTIVAR